MADLILTIDSDDEQSLKAQPTTTQKQAKQPPKESAKSATGKKRKRDANKSESNGITDAANDEDAMDKMFIFDARSGGGMASRTNKFLKPGQWVCICFPVYLAEPVLIVYYRISTTPSNDSGRRMHLYAAENTDF